MDYFRFLKEQHERSKLKKEKRLKAQEERKLKEEKRLKEENYLKGLRKVMTDPGRDPGPLDDWGSFESFSDNPEYLKDKKSKFIAKVSRH